MIKLTLDTNCIINLLDYSSASAISVDQLSEIIRYAMEGNVNIAITTRVQADLEKDKNESRKTEMLKKIDMFPVIGTVARYDSSKWDSGDFYAGPEHAALEKELRDIIFPNLTNTDKRFSNKINDIDHLVGHKKNGRDIFVTDDSDILKKSQTLKDSLNIAVMTPIDCIEYLEAEANKLVLANQYYEMLKKYRDFLLEVYKRDATEKDDSEFEKFREWLIKKTPKIKDDMEQAYFTKQSVAVGTQRVFGRAVLLDMQFLSESLYNLFSQTSLEKQIQQLTDTDSRGYVYIAESSSAPNKIRNKFQIHIDILLTLIGSLE